MAKISPFAPATFPELGNVAGVSFAGAACGIKYKNRTDVLLAVMDKGTSVAGVYTTSKASSAPVLWCRKAQKKGSARALVVNSGNSNAFTGKLGVQSVARVVKATAKEIGCTESEVFMASTGVIGEPLRDHLITNALPELKSNLKSGEWETAARAIMTTDTFPKAATRQAKIGAKKVTISGFVKGSGMIAPNMATMLGFIFTDAVISSKQLQKMLSELTDETFNSITVDGDTSTSDTIMLFATGKAGNKAGDSLADFKVKLREVMLELAHLVVLDGEGVTRFVTIKVKGAASAKAAKNIGLTIANSPLVKTAIAGLDPNWGRIVAAAGRAGEKMVQEKTSVKIGGVTVARNGQVSPQYDDDAAKKYMRENAKIEIEINVGAGKAEWTVWTTDLTHDYITINGSYRS